MLSYFFFATQLVQTLQNREDMLHLTCGSSGWHQRSWEVWDLGASLTDSAEHDVCPLVYAACLLGADCNSACKRSQCFCTMSCRFVMEAGSRCFPLFSIGLWILLCLIEWKGLCHFFLRVGLYYSWHLLRRALILLFPNLGVRDLNKGIKLK